MSWLGMNFPRNYICPGGEESTGPCPVAPSDRNILYENRCAGVKELLRHNLR